MTATQYAPGPRFRLRFLLQEFELPPGDTLIGRSDECHITLFDPLISRKHAKIQVIGGRAVLEDLGSRNGCRVNGAAIRGRHPLTSGDRIRIGKHEFVFGEFAASETKLRERPTGSLVFCAGCDMAYPGEMGMCPNCGSNQALDEETRSGVLNEDGKADWAVDLLVQLVDKSIASGRLEEADRAMREIMTALEHHLNRGNPGDPERLEVVAPVVVRLANAQDDGFWVRWAADYHQRVGEPIPPSLGEALDRWENEDPTTALQ